MPYRPGMDGPLHLAPETFWALAGRLLRYAGRLLARPGSVRIGGLVLRIPAGTTGPVLHSLYAERYERLERALLPALLRADDRVVELGSAIGLIGLVCCRSIAPAQLVMVEANPALIAEISHNFAANRVALPALHHAVAAMADGEADFHIDSQFWASSTRARAGAAQTTIRLATIDTAALIARHRATVLICDIEGGEIDLLPRLDLAGVRLVVAELHPAVIGDDGAARITAHMAAAGLALRQILEKEVYIFGR